MKSKLLLALLIAFFGESSGSRLKAQIPVQDSVFNLFLDFTHSKTEAKRNENSKKFSGALRQALEQDKNAALPFDSLKRYKVMIESPDKQVRIFTWDVEAEDRTHMYYGFIQAYNRKSKRFEVYELKDKSDDIREPENASLDNTRWYGAYYYQVGEYKYKKTKYYVLLGWDGHNGISNRRVIEALYFTDKGFPKFGNGVFTKENGKVVKRVIFEFQAGVFMSLKYDQENNAILFDHLSPSNPSLEGQYEFYGPDFSYDMLELKDGKWEYKRNADARNSRDRTDRYFNTPK